MTLHNHLNAIVVDFKTLFAAASVETHRGRFTLSELKKLGAKLPAVRIALGNVLNVTLQADDQLEIICEFWTAIITKDVKALPRHEAAANMVDALILHLPGNRLGSGFAFGAENVTAANLFGGDVDNTGVMMWEVRFRQKLRLGTDIFNETGVLPADLYLGAAPKIGTAHRPDYRHLETGNPPPEVI